MVSGAVWVRISHEAGSDDVFMASVEVPAPVTCQPSAATTINEIPGSLGTAFGIDQTYPVLGIFPVTAGSTTFRVSARFSNAAGTGDAVERGRATAVFHPD